MPSGVIVPLKLNPTVQTMLGGLAVSGGSGEVFKIVNTVGPASGDTWYIDLLNSQTQINYTIGLGSITGLVPTFTLTYDQKVYVLAGSTAYFSAVGLPTVWNDLNATGNGNVSMADAYQTPEALTAAVPYQGRMAFFSRHTTQIWEVNADPDLWVLKQVLNNIGTMAPASVQALGGLDALFLSDSGIRSLRVRDINLNAFVDDLGSPIDSLIQAQLIANPAAALTALATVEPSAGRYMLFLNSVFYVLSYFPSSKVVAWSQYYPSAETGFSFTVNTATSGTIIIQSPNQAGALVSLNAATSWNTNASTTAADLVTAINARTSITGYSASAVGAVVTVVGIGKVNTAALSTAVLTGNMTISAFSLNTTSFTPTKFVIYNGQVYMKAGNVVYQYGGYNNNQYDSTVATVITPFQDYKTPGQRKLGVCFDAAFTGAWSLSASMDPVGQVYETFYTAGVQSFDQGFIPCPGQGTHQSVKAVTTGHTAAVLSAIIPHYTLADEE